MKKAARAQVPEVHSMVIGKEDKRETAPTTSVNIIQEIMSLSGNALSRAIRNPDNKLLADVVLEILLEDIDALTGKRSLDECSLARGGVLDCPVTNKVATEMVKIQSATGRCLDLIDDMIRNKSYDLGLKATLQCLRSINRSVISLLSPAQDLEASPDSEDSSTELW